jgi:DNA ligase-1
MDGYNDKIIKPLLAVPLDWSRLKYPVFVSPKLDGIRCLAQDGRPWSRTHKVLPNRHLQQQFQDLSVLLEGLDGEIIVGSSHVPNVYNVTTSAVMSENGIPNFEYWVFDDITEPNLPYEERLDKLRGRAQSLPKWAHVLPQFECATRESVESVEQEAIKLGYEGVIVRSLSGPYKQGRSTVNQGYLLKLKRFEDAEARVVGYEELQHNDNVATTDVQGHTHRTSHRANMRPGNKLGALTVTDMETPGLYFSIGSGFDDQERMKLWAERDTLIGRIVTYKCQPHGRLVAPRFPIFIRFRHEIDM